MPTEKNSPMKSFPAVFTNPGHTQNSDPQDQALVSHSY